MGIIIEKCPGGYCIKGMAREYLFSETEFMTLQNKIRKLFDEGKMTCHEVRELEGQACEN